MAIINVIQTIKSNVYARSLAILLLGVAIGATFYPSKNIKESVSRQYEQQIQSLNEQHKTEVSNISKSYEDKISTLQSTQIESQSKINSLTTQVTDLQSHKVTNYYKVVHPDGTIEIKQSSEDDSSSNSSVISQVQQEWQQKIDDQIKVYQIQQTQIISSMQQQFDQKSAQYQQTIDSLQKTKSVQVNPKKFGVELGYMANTDYYGHITYTLFGPFDLGLHSEFGTVSNSVGAGLVFRF